MSLQSIALHWHRLMLWITGFLGYCCVDSGRGKLPEHWLTVRKGLAWGESVPVLFAEHTSAADLAQVNFPNPPAGQPQWLALAQGVFNSQAPRWDTASCAGGLKWQISPLNNGYNYKNSISNGCFFNMAARLGLYTGNSSYLDWAEKTWDWVAGPVGLINNQSYVFDGSDDTIDCTKVSHLQWSYNAGVFLYGAAVMYNATEGDTRAKWQTRTRGLLTGIASMFFQNQTMTEVACESGANCNIDQQTFKAYLARWMAASVKVAPWTHDTIMPLIRASALAAARSVSLSSSPVKGGGGGGGGG